MTSDTGRLTDKKSDTAELTSKIQNTAADSHKLRGMSKSLNSEVWSVCCYGLRKRLEVSELASNHSTHSSATRLAKFDSFHKYAECRYRDRFFGILKNVLVPPIQIHKKLFVSPFQISNKVFPPFSNSKKSLCSPVNYEDFPLLSSRKKCRPP